MGVLGDIVKALIHLVERGGNPFGRKLYDLNEEEAAREVEEDFRVAENTIEEAFGGFFDALEDDVINQVLDEGELTPDNVEEAIDGAEGAAIEDSVGAMVASLAVELAGGTQLESHQVMVSQILSFMALENVLGRRLGMVYEKGVDPALEAEIAKKTRSEYVSLPDAVEFALRTREGDRGFLGGPNTSERAFDAVGSKNPVNPNNILEEWGIRDDNLGILEEVSLEAIEAEELMESPIQFGVIPDPELVRQNAKRAGNPEEIIDLFVETAENAPRSSDLWEQRTTTEELVSELDTLVGDGEISPDDAVRLLPDEVDNARPALRDRWELLTQVPNKAPTRAQYTNAFAWGLLSRERFNEALRAVDVDPDEHPAVVKAAILDELDGDLQAALAAGIIRTGEYVGLAEWAGVNQKAIDSLRRGQTWSQTKKAILASENTTEGSGVDVISGIGPARADELKTFGITTLGELANANPVGLANALNVSEAQARNWVESAQRRS